MRSKDKKEINIIVGENIRKYRGESGYTREKFAELIDVSVGFVADAESGFVGVSLTKLKRICEVLGISADRLLWNDATDVDLNERISHVDKKYIPLIENLLQNQLEVIALATKDETKKKTRN